MKQKLRVIMSEDFDEELNAIAAITILLNRLPFDAQWRVLNYVVVRLWGRCWSFSRPKADGA